MPLRARGWAAAPTPKRIAYVVGAVLIAGAGRNGRKVQALDQQRRAMLPATRTMDRLVDDLIIAGG